MKIEELKYEFDSIFAKARQDELDAAFYLRILAQAVLTHGQNGFLAIDYVLAESAKDTVENCKFEFGDGGVRIIPPNVEAPLDCQIEPLPVRIIACGGWLCNGPAGQICDWEMSDGTVRALSISQDRMQKMADEFIYCPRCKSKNIVATDYEDDHGEEDTEGRRCEDCGWEGEADQLVCA